MVRFGEVIEREKQCAVYTRHSPWKKSKIRYANTEADPTTHIAVTNHGWYKTDPNMAATLVMLSIAERRWRDVKADEFSKVF